MTRPITFTDPVGNVSFEFEEKLEHLPGLVIEHFWLNKSRIYGGRRRSSPILIELLQFFRLQSQRQGDWDDAEVRQIYLLASLCPYRRSTGSHRVMADASLSPSQIRSVRGSPENDLDSLLSQSRHERILIEEMRDRAAAALGLPTFSAAEVGLYDEMSRELLIEPSRLLQHDHEQALRVARNRWEALNQRFGRHRGHANEKRVLDGLSYEMKTAAHHIYSGVWRAALPTLCQTARNPGQTFQFNQLWHTELSCPAGPQSDDLYHVFNGHVLGLHPAPSLILGTPTGREQVARWLLADPREEVERFWEVLHAVMVALHYYMSLREPYNATRRGGRVHRLRDDICTAILTW